MRYRDFLEVLANETLGEKTPPDDPLTTWLESAGISFLAWAWNADFACWPAETGGGASAV